MARKLKYDVKRAFKEWQSRYNGKWVTPVKFFQSKQPLWQAVQTDSNMEDLKVGQNLFDGKEDHTKYDILHPLWKDTVFEEILNDYNAYSAKIRIMPPMSTLNVHTDGWTPSLYVYMFPILTNEDSFFIVQTEGKPASFTHAWNAWHHPADGSVYQTRYDIPHAAMNGGTTPKVNLQFRSKDDL